MSWQAWTATFAWSWQLGALPIFLGGIHPSPCPGSRPPCGTGEGARPSSASPEPREGMAPRTTALLGKWPPCWRAGASPLTAQQVLLMTRSPAGTEPGRVRARQSEAEEQSRVGYEHRVRQSLWLPGSSCACIRHSAAVCSCRVSTQHSEVTPALVCADLKPYVKVSCGE